MLGKYIRPATNKVTAPIAKALLSLGLTPNITTAIGTTITVVAAVLLIPSGHLFAAAMILWLFVMFDMLDGAMARVSDSGTRFGAVLDATCDRIADGVIFACVVWWIVFTMPGGVEPLSHRWLLVATLISLVASQVISYAKARAEASGLNGDGGFIERPERLTIVLTGIGLTGLGLTPAVHIAMWILAIGSVITIAQRLYWVYHSPGARQSPRIPIAATDFIDTVILVEANDAFEATGSVDGTNPVNTTDPHIETQSSSPKTVGE